MRISEEYAKMAAEVIEENEDLHFLRECSIGFLASDEEKTKSGRDVCGECWKVSKRYDAFCPFDMLIAIYEPNCAGMSPEQMKILIRHELMHIDVTEGKEGIVWKTKPHDVEDFRKIIEQYGIDWARR